MTTSNFQHRINSIKEHFQLTQKWDATTSHLVGLIEQLGTVEENRANHLQEEVSALQEKLATVKKELKQFHRMQHFALAGGEESVKCLGTDMEFHSTPTPVARRLHALIKLAFDSARGLPRWRGNRAPGPRGGAHGDSELQGDLRIPGPGAKDLEFGSALGAARCGARISRAVWRDAGLQTYVTVQEKDGQVQILCANPGPLTPIPLTPWVATWEELLAEDWFVTAGPSSAE